MPKQLFFLFVVGLNAIPVYGVFHWGWQSFDLIFLYWLENVIIGMFTLLRFVIRPYQHPVEIIMPLLFAPFFAVHYGMFCMGHGLFIFSIFGEDRLDVNGLLGPLQAIAPVLQQNHLLLAAISLALLQLFDWLRDINERGLGCDNIKDLMTAPYRRIIVLHVTILASGFALGAMHEPLAGLLILVALKTTFDLYHWRKDEAVAKLGQKIESGFELTPEKIKEIEEKFPEPKVEVNGQAIYYDSYQELKDSKHFRLMAAIMRMMGIGKEYQAIEKYLDMKIAEEKNKTPQPAPRT